MKVGNISVINAYECFFIYVNCLFLGYVVDEAIILLDGHLDLLLLLMPSISRSTKGCCSDVLCLFPRALMI